jgi:hypothetical protein
MGHKTVGFRREKAPVWQWIDVLRICLFDEIEKGSNNKGMSSDGEALT